MALLEQKLARDKAPVRVVNASISGDTTSGGRSRLAALLAQHQPAVVVIELGGNDALRGLPLDLTADNLGWMTQAAQKAGARVLLVGMQVPPNYGADYGRRFPAVFAEVAKANKAAVVPFMLKGVADGADPTRLFQADRIHPTQEAHPIILATSGPNSESCSSESAPSPRRRGPGTARRASTPSSTPAAKANTPRTTCRGAVNWPVAEQRRTHPRRHAVQAGQPVRGAEDAARRWWRAISPATSSAR